MDIFDLIISTILIIGIGFVLYLFLCEPLNILNSFLRALKSHPFWHIRIISFPIWGPVWVIDKILLSSFTVVDTSNQLANGYRSYPIAMGLTLSENISCSTYVHCNEKYVFLNLFRA